MQGMNRSPPATARKTAPPAPSDASVSPADRLRGRLMAQALGRLLDQARGARDVLPHLAALERSLLSKGVTAIDLVPPHWLGRICSQLASLPMSDDDLPLHDLLSRLNLKLRGGVAEEDPWDNALDFDPERTMVVREVSHTAFDEAQAEQAITIVSPEA